MKEEGTRHSLYVKNGVVVRGEGYCWKCNRLLKVGDRAIPYSNRRYYCPNCFDLLRIDSPDDEEEIEVIIITPEGNRITVREKV